MELISRNEDKDKVETKAPEILKYTYIILQGKYMVCYLISKSMHKLII